MTSISKAFLPPQERPSRQVIRLIERDPVIALAPLEIAIDEPIPSWGTAHAGIAGSSGFLGRGIRATAALSEGDGRGILAGHLLLSGAWMIAPEVLAVHQARGADDLAGRVVCAFGVLVESATASRAVVVTHIVVYCRSAWIGRGHDVPLSGWPPTDSSPLPSH